MTSHVPDDGEETFFRSNEKRQLQTAFRSFLTNTRSPSFEIDEDNQSDEEDDDEENLHLFFQSKLQWFQLFIRTQSIAIRHFRSEETPIDRATPVDFLLLLLRRPLVSFIANKNECLSNVSSTWC